METIEGFDFVRVVCNGDGRLESQDTMKEMQQHIVASNVSDVIFIAHGFRNDADDATGLYKRFLHSFRQDIARPEFAGTLPERRILVAGVYWPSKKFSEGDDDSDGSAQAFDDGAATAANEHAGVVQQLEELREFAGSPEQAAHIDAALGLLSKVEGSAEAQDAFVAHVLAVAPEAVPDPTEGLNAIAATPGSELLEKLATPIFLPTVQASDAGDGGTMSIADSDSVGGGGVLSIGSAFKSVTGRIGQFLNLTTWYAMKNLSGTVGARAVADCVRELREMEGGDSLKIHLVGHSLGGRLVTAAAKSLAGTPGVSINSLTLLEAAFSHHGFSGRIESDGQRGFFREVMESDVVSGPLISTFSYQDTVVGKAYAVSSRLAGDNAKAIGDAGDVFGGIGRNGTQKTVEAVSEKLHAPGVPYDAFVLKKVNNLDGSGGLITEHGDVTNPNVTYAFASAMAST